VHAEDDVAEGRNAFNRPVIKMEAAVSGRTGP